MAGPYAYSPRSRARLETCNPRLQSVFNEVILHTDCTILAGRRSEAEQNEAFDTGRSQLRYPESKHNKAPSLAVDVAPFPIDWENRERFLLFAGFVKGVAAAIGIRLRLGADWDGDGDTRDQRFHDVPHFELID